AAVANSSEADVCIVLMENIVECRHDTGAGGSQRVTDSHSAAENIDLVFADSHVAVEGHSHYRKSFVDFKIVNIGSFHTSHFQCFFSGEGWGSGKPFGCLRSIAESQDTCHRFQTVFFNSLFAGEHKR